MSPFDPGTDITKPRTVAEMLRLRDAIRERVAGAVATLQEAAVLCRQIGPYATPWGYHHELEDAVSGGPERIFRALDKHLWRELFEFSGMRELMDASAVEEFHRQLDKDPPECTEANVETTFAQLYADRDEIFLRGLREVVKSLSPGYKSNRTILEHRVVLNNALPTYNWNFYSKADAMVRDLDRVFRILDGAPHRPEGMDVADLIAHKRRTEGPGTVVTEYLTTKSFRNGNLHIHFNRRDLVEKANRLLEGNGDKLDKKTKRRASA